MSILVFTRSTPDTTAQVKADADGRATWDNAALIPNPWDDYALEEAIVQAKASGSKAIAVALGGDLHLDALKHGLAMGLDEAIRIDDPALDPADSLSYAITAAAAARKLGDVDLVLFGRESVDVGSDQHIYQTARKLGWTMLSYVSKIIAIDYAAKTIRVERLLEQGKQTVSATLPAVISVVKDINEPRYPSFIGIRKAGKAVIPVWSLADLGITDLTPKTRVNSFKNLPPRDSRSEILTGSPEEIAETLVKKLMEEKVL